MYRRANVQVEQGPCVVCYGPPELAIHEGDLCVVKSDRYLEVGRVTRIEVVEAQATAAERANAVLRRATLQDQSKASENAVKSRMALDLCHKRMAELHLEFHIISARYSFDRAVLFVAFMAEERVDCHALVTRLEAELHARVEMRLYGVRDTAKIIGGMGPCGQVMCCKRWIDSFDAVSVKMAKAQRLSLSPSTISGMCGRLKCCLRYEYDCYKSLSARLPRDGEPVQCPGGCGRVEDRDILRQRVRVRLSDDRVVECEAGEVKAAPEPPGARGGRPS